MDTFYDSPLSILAFRGYFTTENTENTEKTWVKIRLSDHLIA